MLLTVTRQQGTALSTPGLLAINGIFECYTLEPRMDRLRGKPYAIPAGHYAVALERSPHFSTIMGYNFLTPHILNVPGFEHIEIHPGNKPADTQGCCLVGETRDPTAPDWIGNSVLAFTRLIACLQSATAAGESLSIEYRDAAPLPATTNDNASSEDRAAFAHCPSDDAANLAVTDPDLGL